MVIKDIIRSENAVSEVVDVVLILGIMLIAITVITVAGFPALQDMQESGHQENIRQSFMVLGENVNKIVFDNAPSQSVELKMYGGGIWISGNSTISVTVQSWNSSSSSVETRESAGRQIRELQNEFEGTTISYENTGIWAKYQTGEAIMVREPQFVYSDSMLVIPAAGIENDIDGNEGVSGEGLIRVIAKGGKSMITSYQNVSAVDIYVNNSLYYTGWTNYLNETMEMQIINSTPSTVHAHKDYTDENIDVYVIKTPLRMSIE
ncbi:DUF7289 family protein [Methanococcoides sp. FTZ1]|uniref:DUF7289 family protein n=1 Tax=Methanococcoides sp. FTZ1 TaxID=3439061 RepID=UPI003F839A40